MGMLKEFKDFAMRGNVLDMAIGVVIGGAFGKIVTSMVNDIIMPPLGMILGKVDFSSLKITMQEAVDKTPAVAINYGAFINTIIDFVIVAFCIFLVIKQVNRFTKKPEAARRADDETLRILPDGHPHQGHPLPELHVAIGLGGSGGRRIRLLAVSTQFAVAAFASPAPARQCRSTLGTAAGFGLLYMRRAWTNSHSLVSLCW